MTSRATIAIPTLNRAKYLQVALQSALAQTWPNLEIIVSDNASTDGTAALLAGIDDPRLVRLRQPATVPVFDHWDSCLRNATGDYFLMLSDDDMLDPHAIEQMVQIFEDARARGEELGFVTCRTTVIDGSGAMKYRGSPFPVSPTLENILLAFFRSECEIVPCGVLYPTAAIRPGYRQYADEFSLAADAVVWIKRIIETGHAGFVDRDLAFYRAHDNTTARTPLSKWYSENLELADYVVAQLRAHGLGDDILYRKIRLAAVQLNQRITAQSIANTWIRSKPDAFALARQYARKLANPYGASVLIKALISATVPRAWRPSLVALRRRARNPLH